MKAIDVLKNALRLSHGRARKALVNLHDAPLAQPTAVGGNHATWVAGHLAYRERQVIDTIMQAKPNVHAGWAPLFDMGSIPQTDASSYPAYDELLGAFDSAHENTLAIVRTLSETDLDRTSAQCPAGREETFGTFGQCFVLMSIHPAMHLGQLLDVRRTLGRVTA